MIIFLILEVIMAMIIFFSNDQALVSFDYYGINGKEYLFWVAPSILNINWNFWNDDKPPDNKLPLLLPPPSQPLIIFVVQGFY